MLRAYFGRHKAASTWTRSILHEAAAALNLEITTIHVPRQWEPYPTLGDMVRDRKPDILVMTNARQEDIDTLPEFRGINVVRDPRDMVVSGYFSHRNSHPLQVMGITWDELVVHREYLLSASKDDGLMAEIEFSGAFLRSMVDWDYHQPNVLELRMEELITDPVKNWTLMLSHFDMLKADTDPKRLLHLAAVKWNLAKRRGVPKTLAYLRKVLPALPMRKLPVEYVDYALSRFTFSRMAGSERKPGEEDPNSHYRKGVPGDWRNHLNEAHLARFRASHADRIRAIGYEVQ